MIRYMTAGESHGEALVSIIDGIPFGLSIDKAFIDNELKKRMLGYGRGQRMKIELDQAKILSGVRKGKTIASPLCILIKNKDFSIDTLPSISKARPGHADLAGALKFNEKDIRNILERASARETAARVACGAVVKLLLAEFGIDVLSHVVSIGPIQAQTHGLSFDRIKKLSLKSDLRCADKTAEELMKSQIDIARSEGDTLGGVSEIIFNNVPPGLGSFSQWDRRLGANLGQALLSIPATKGVEIGGGFNLAGLRGSHVHDQILSLKKGVVQRQSNNAGGLEGGMTNGENIVLRIAMKPISTLAKPLKSIDIKSKKIVKAQVERADVCAVSSCGVIAEAVSAIVIANAMIEKFGGDSIDEMKRNFKGHKEAMKRF